MTLAYTNPADDNVTRAAGVTNLATTAGATVETLVETVVLTNGNHQLVPVYVNMLAVAYPWGMPQNVAAHFANEGAFFPHPTLTSLATIGNNVFPWGVPTIQTPPVDAANPEDNQGQVPHETPDVEGEYQGPRPNFHIPAQPTSTNQAAPFSYPEVTSVPMMTYAPTNLALQYVQTGVPQAPNAQAGGQYPHMVHAAQIVPPGFSYPPQMLFAPQNVPVQAIAPETSWLASQVVPPAVDPTRPADYQLLDDIIRAIEGFSAFGIDARDLCLVPNVALPQMFKVPDLPKYKGLCYPHSHITMYCRKMVSYIDNDDLLVHCFQDSLSGASLDWYIGLECNNIRSWRDLFEAFLK